MVSKPAPPATSLAAAESTAVAASKSDPTSPLQIAKELSKARLSALVVMTTGAGSLFAGTTALASGGTVAAAAVGTALCAASAATLNQAWEINTDKLMPRTAQRPLPSGRATMPQALTFGFGTGILGTGILLAGCNPITAALGLANIGLYSLIYTPMKLKSEWNTWVGALVGAIPPVMGYAAVTNQLVAPESALLAGMLFLWQFPHFFSLAWLNRKDYMLGGHQMVSCNDPTGMRTARIIRNYTAAMVPLPYAATYMGLTTHMWSMEATVVHLFWLYQAQKFVKNPSNGNARKIFRTSLWYLPVVLGLMCFHSKHWQVLEGNEEGEDVVRDVVRSIISIVRPYGTEKCPHEVLLGRTTSTKKKREEGALQDVVNALPCPAVSSSTPSSSTR
jgi:protoheme IX farnesyltransferase